MFKEHEQVVLTAPTRNDDGELMRPGDVGVIVHVHPNHESYVVEYFGINGETVSTGTALPTQIRPVSSRDVLHARRDHRFFIRAKRTSLSPVFSAKTATLVRYSGTTLAREGKTRRRVFISYSRNRLIRRGQSGRGRARSKGNRFAYRVAS